MSRPLVRVNLPGERSWGECIDEKEGLYRSLDDCIGDVPLNLPQGVAGLPDGHPGPELNGLRIRLRWGHIFRGKPCPRGGIDPVEIVGWDGTPRPT